jgi:hypothetical protein
MRMDYLLGLTPKKGIRVHRESKGARNMRDGNNAGG